jgi:hypothetical protein
LSAASRRRRSASERAASGALAAIAVAVIAVTGCALLDRPHAPYAPERDDYFAFRGRHADLAEPNYLPFMLHRVRDRRAGADVLLLCRWSDADLPLRVFIAPPDIPDDLQDEFHPTDPLAFVQAVSDAFAMWEHELEGAVRFTAVANEREARLVVRIHGEPAPLPSEEVQVLGTTPDILTACEVEAGDLSRDPLPVRFRVRNLDLYVADEAGLLMPEQLGRVALHEIGHALGMRGHSRVPVDLMYRVASDRLGADVLSPADVHSFLALYTLPNGTVYARLPDDRVQAHPEPRPPSKRPSLEGAPHVDARNGFELRTPDGWLRMATDEGMFVANGPEWDRDASLEIRVWRYPTIDQLLARYGRVFFIGTHYQESADLAVAGRPAWTVRVYDAAGAREQEFTFIELETGRVMMLLSDCPAEYADEWRPWFRDVLATLELWREPRN